MLQCNYLSLLTLNPAAMLLNTWTHLPSFHFTHSVSLWLLWCVFFFGLAWFLNHFYRRQVEKMNYCSPGGFFCKCVDERCVPRRKNGASDADSDDGEEKDKLLSKLMV